METHQLLFELSHPVRYSILKLLVDKPLRLTKIGEKVDANNPEVSRHLDRLKTADLVSKNPDGYYSVTMFGRVIFGLLPAISFVSAHPEFFLEHDLSLLPPEFMTRLGDLESCEVVEGTTQNILKLDELYDTTKERIWSLSNENIKLSDGDLDDMDDVLDSGFDFQMILQESQLREKNMIQLVDRCASHLNDHFRIIPQVPFFCTIVDDQVVIAFLDMKRRVDFSVSFWSQDPKVVKWCEDLFTHLWNTGHTVDVASE